MKKKKILFFAHAVTLAHFVRPLKWINSLNLNEFEIYLASKSDLKSLITKEGIGFIEINCIDATKFFNIVRDAQPIYDKVTFEKHIEEDINIIDRINPDIVVGDFRHSLSVSCRIKKVKYINITNAYWSPELVITNPMPEAPAVRFFGETIYKLFLAPVIPFILKFNFFMMAFALRDSLSKAGLKVNDYRRIITDGDVALFCDTPELVPLRKTLNNEVYLGPLLWSTPVDLPLWWNQLKPNRKRILVSLGSSGDINLLPDLTYWLSKIDADVIVALSGKKISLTKYENIFIVDFLPIENVLSTFSLVICNGGSPMSHSALTFGVPTIGIVFNNDQLLNMAHVEKRGAGVTLRYWNLSQKKFTDSVETVLNEPSFKNASQQIKTEFSKYDVMGKLQSLLKS